MSFRHPLLLVLPLLLMGATSAQAAGPSAKTIANLETAIDAEANAANRYQLFAARADEDGYPQVARLFRAAAKAESIHRENHALAVISLGGKSVRPELYPVSVRSTAENLKASTTGESKEFTQTYPAFIEQARKDQAGQAAQSFVQARDTEMKHNALFKGALANLGHEQPEDYYVSKRTGDTIAIPSGQSPPEARAREYERVG